MKTFTREEAVAYLRKMQGKKDIEDFAREHNVSSQLVRDVYRGKRLPGKSLGFLKIIESFRFKRVEKNETRPAVR